MTPQEALAQLQVGCLTVWEAKKCFKVVEEALDEGKKAKEILEIIKKKRVNVSAFDVLETCKEYNDYCDMVGGQKHLTETEFNLIKEWLER